MPGNLFPKDEKKMLFFFWNPSCDLGEAISRQIILIAHWWNSLIILVNTSFLENDFLQNSWYLFLSLYFKVSNFVDTFVFLK